MMSIETRNAVKHYELSQNALLRSILPGGLLESLRVQKRCEALLVPRQASLEVVDIARYFVATSQRSSSTLTVGLQPPVRDLSGDGEEEVEKDSENKAKTSSTSDAAGTPCVTFPPENADAFKAALARFLDYHLLQFDSLANSEFINLIGQRGAFAEDLDHVKRFGFVGKIAVVADADALLPMQKSVNSVHTASEAGSASCCLSSLQIFIIDQPLMDANEISFIRNTLRKLTVSSAPRILESERVTQSAVSPAGISVLMEDANAAIIPASLHSISKHVNSSALTSTRVAQRLSRDGREHEMLEESFAETIVIEDFEDEPPEDPDLEAYVSKYTHISERQRERQSIESRSTENTAARAGSSDGLESPVCGAPPPATSCSCVQETQANPAVVTLSDQKFLCRSPTAASDPTTILHANVLRHEYSRECIKDYRRVVAADNEIDYDVFERIMGLRCSTSLAKMLSEYVSKNQQLLQPIIYNPGYNSFIGRCHAELGHVKYIIEDKRRMSAVKEGIERYTTTRLYRQLFNVCESEKRANSLLQQKLLRLENMSPARLDAMPEVERHHVWGQAMFELDGMDFFKSPREKLRCGMRACELLSLAVGDVLRQRRSVLKVNQGRTTATSTNPGGVPLAFGADEFLPCFLLLVLRARPLNFVHNVCYIEKFRYHTLMSPEESYCLATMQSSLVFWQNCQDDGQMLPMEATGSAPGGGASPSHAAGTLTLHAVASRPSPHAEKMRQKHPPPRMTEEDLLPSVRQASMSRRQQVTGANSNQQSSGAAALLPNGDVKTQERSPTVLEVLFGWTNRQSTPIDNERSLGDEKSALNGISAQRPGAGRSSSLPVPGLAAHQLPPRGTVIASESAVPQAKVVRGSSVTLHHPTASAPSLSLEHSAPSGSTRERVREILVTQNKGFDKLTLSELQLIVEEARRLLRERR